MPVAGVPEGLALDTLNELCLQRFVEPLAHVSHLHLSGWKAAGSFRLSLQTSGGRHWSVVFKNAIYSMDHIPALATLPITPGPPEYLVYSNVRGALTRYVPAVYFCIEKIPGRHYQYLLEDVGQEYQRVGKPQAVLNAVRELPAIHRALTEWSLAVDQDRLLKYDREFSVALQENAERIFQRYAQRTGSTAVSEVCKLWPQISEVYLSKEFQKLEATCPIHGDFNRANILMHKTDPDRIKLVDWEWSGLGVAHSDLASLLKTRIPEIKVRISEIEQQALAIFAEQYNQLSLDEHRRLYQWCQLERGLLDAVFCAAQLMGRQTKLIKLNLPWVVNNATQRVIRAYQELA